MRTARWAAPLVIGVSCLVAASCKRSREGAPGAASATAGASSASKAAPVAAAEIGLEIEPNNRAADATPLVAGRSIKGTLATSEDEDWFKLSAVAQPGQFLRIDLSGVPGVRPQLELRALADGTLLATFRAPGEGEGISLRDISLAGELAAPLPPQLRAAAPDAGGSAIGSDSSDAGADAEAASETGADAAVEMVGTQTIGTPNIGTPSNSPAAVDLDAGASASDAGAATAPPDTIAEPAVEPPDAATTPPPPAPSDSTAHVAPSVVEPAAAVIVAPPSEPPGFYLVVRSAPLTNEKKARRGANAEVAYTLSTALEAGARDLEAEPNDDAQHANWLASTRTGFLSPSGDADWYRVRNEGKSVLRAEVSGLAHADLELAVYAPSANPGEKPQLLARANEGGAGEGELLPSVGIDGDALVLVGCAQHDVGGAKVRDCEDRSASYVVNVSLAADDGTIEREPNDDLDRAQPISLPARITGALWPRRDVDLFRFHLDAPRSLSFRLSAVRGVDTMLTLRQLKPGKDGRTISEVIGTSDAVHAEGPEMILSVPFKPGDYAIEVASPRREGSATQTYLLSAE